jgi:hypothetical protein
MLSLIPNKKVDNIQKSQPKAFSDWILILLMMASVSPALSQNDLEDSPIAPAERDRYKGYLGLIVGLGPNIQSGDMNVRCESCLFDNGMGTGFNAALKFEHYFFDELSLGIAAGYDSYSFTSQYREISNRSFTAGEGTRSVRLPLEIQQTAELDLNLLTVMPYVRYRPFEMFSLKAGIMPAFGSPGLTHTESVINTVHSIGGELYIIDQLRPNENLDSGDVPDGAESMQLFGVLGLETHFWLRYNLNINIGAEWRQPFTTNDFYGSDFVIYGPRFTAGIEYMIYREIFAR